MGAAVGGGVSRGCSHLTLRPIRTVTPNNQPDRRGLAIARLQARRDQEGGRKTPPGVRLSLTSRRPGTHPQGRGG